MERDDDKSTTHGKARVETPRIGSLFSGIGALDLATEAVCGGEVAWHSEVDPYACHVLQQWWPDVPNLGNIQTVRHFPEASILCGGFPCQDISSAGTRTGLRGRRSGLWSEFARAIREVGPKVVVVENVGQLRARGLDQVLAELAKAGFDAEWTSLRAANVGAPHRRERVFILAYADRVFVRELAERLELDPTKRWDAWVGKARELVADAVRKRCPGLGAPHHSAGRGLARRDDADRQDASVVFPPRPDDGEAWVSWSRAGRAQPGVCRGAYGSARGVHARRRRSRLRCLGGAVLPQQAATALLTLLCQAA